MKLYNTLTRKREEFVPIKKGQVGMYCCGPTVYNFAHIGNLRSYIFSDVLKRVLKFNNYKVKHVMNITDVGHLTSDADEGEDKMILAMRREGKTAYQIAEFYTKAFKGDIKKLNIIEPDIWCKATEHIKEQIELIEKLEKKGFTYKTSDGIYFDTSKLKDYGKLAKIKIEELQAGKRVGLGEKKSKTDFALWKFSPKDKKREMEWASPFGKGFPGWHLECSAMSMKYLGKQFDIHTGGIDHIPVHHTNEIAQSEAAISKKPWVKYWLHGEFLVLAKGEKMAKSGENFITLSTLEKKGFSPLDYRYFCLGTHYRKPLMFSYEALEGAKVAYKKLVEKVLELKGSKGKENKILQKKYLETFTKDINDDLNTPKALATMWEVIKENKITDKDKYLLLLIFDEILGLGLKYLKKDKIPEKIVELAEERLKARNGKDWKKSDQLREEIKKLGYIVGDTKEGYEINKA